MTGLDFRILPTRFGWALCLVGGIAGSACSSDQTSPSGHTGTGGSGSSGATTGTATTGSSVATSSSTGPSGTGSTAGGTTTTGSGDTTSSSASTTAGSGGSTTTGAGGSTGSSTSTGSGGAGGSPRPDAGGGGSGVFDAGGLGDAVATGFPTVTSFDVDACHDLDIAVSPKLVAVATNPGVITFYTKDGKVDHKAQPFANAGEGDAHLVWDVSTSRWFFSTLQPSGNSDAAFVFASKDETGTMWTAKASVVGPTNLDNPQLVVTTDKVCVLNFDCIYTLDKSTVMAGSTASLMGPSNCGIKHDDQTYGVDYGPNVPSTCYFTVMADASHFNYVTVDGTPAANNVMMQQHQLAVTGFKEVSPFPGVTAFGGAVTRASGALGMWNGNHLVWSRTGMCGTDICARVFDVDTQAGSLKNYDFTVAGSSMWSATVGLDSSNNIFTLIAQTSSTIPISLAVGGVSASGAVIKPQIVQQGNGAFPADQFGDFFASSQDPVDGSVWAVGNYASGSNKCGARVVHIVAK